ncbi:E3 ubiquitin-protein ligase itt1, partial [Cladorrhinum samala]
MVSTQTAGSKSENPNSTNQYDLLILTDATMSMKTYLRSLITSLEAIIRISATTDCFSNIGVLAYRDVDCHRPLTEWSGWYGRNGATAHQKTSHKGLLKFVLNLQTAGGYTWDEATKTGLARAYEVMRRDAKTVILLYADAPPHMAAFEGWERDGKAEREALLAKSSYGGTGRLFADWVSAAKTLSAGQKQAQVFPIVELTYLRWEAGGVYAYLAEMTGGTCVSFDKRPSVEDVSKVTVNLLLSWMGVEKQGTKLVDATELGSHVRFKTTEGIREIAAEDDGAAAAFLPLERNPPKLREGGLVFSPMSLDSLARTVPRRNPPLMDFAKRYAVDPSYRKLVVTHLGDIIDSDVAAMALNPVFGTLWRTVCNDRSNPARDDLITRFGLSVSRIADFSKKERMTQWLEESYDRAGEVLEVIKSVPAEERYPCVFLDPTLRFAPQDGGEECAGMTFTRDELLEIGRSCDYKILRRLGRILTRLTYVASEEEMPAHIRDAPEDEVPRIPTALVEARHRRQFWKIILHTVLPGTMLAARPAALVAALSIRMGIKALEASAHAELVSARDGWNTLEIPETWNTNCLNLLLDADRKHRRRGLLSTETSSTSEAQTTTSILKEQDRALFRTLVSYKLLEMNLDTSLTARTGFTPEKTKLSLGPTATCKSCKHPRSVTIMGAGGICGLCHQVRRRGSGDRESESSKTAPVAEDLDPSTIAATETMSWVECAMADCKAQYVVYFPENLNVRPKCHYCRLKGSLSQDPKNPDLYAKLTTAPCVSCAKCRNKMIWPEEYRSSSASEEHREGWQCPACVQGAVKTVVEETVTARELIKDEEGQRNGTGWLIRNQGEKIPKAVLFSGRSVFYVVSNLNGGREDLADKVEVLPEDAATKLQWHGKEIHNADEVLGSLRSWVVSGRVESGTCSLCFSNLKKRDLRPACGRKGCREVVCEDCLGGWYGINGLGRIINVAALSCPFCRRQPSTKVKLPEGLRYLGGLNDAVAESGSWVYGWCKGCGFAKRHLERVCAAGAPDEVQDFKCEDCLLKKMTKEIVIKDCPGCGVSTEKGAGCDHIECPNCGMHWCFYCRAASSVDSIYKHMSDEHGGWYNGEPYEGGYDDMDE